MRVSGNLLGLFCLQERMLTRPREHESIGVCTGYPDEAQLLNICSFGLIPFAEQLNVYRTGEIEDLCGSDDNEWDTNEIRGQLTDPRTI